METGVSFTINQVHESGALRQNLVDASNQAGRGIRYQRSRTGKDVRPVQYSCASARLLGETCCRETYPENSASALEAELARRDSH